MEIPLFMLYSRFFCGCHTNSRLSILRDFAEMHIEFQSFLQSSLLGESAKKGHLNFRVSLRKRKFKDFETRHSLFDNFFWSKIERNRPKLMTALVTHQILNTGSSKV